MYAVGENLLMLLETVPYETGSIRGTNMSYEIVDNILNFFVNYNFFVRKPDEEIPRMETMKLR